MSAQPRVTLPMTLPPDVDPDTLVSVVYISRDPDGSCSARASDMQGRVPFERRQLANALWLLADLIESQAAWVDGHDMGCPAAPDGRHHVPDDVCMHCGARRP